MSLMTLREFARLHDFPPPDPLGGELVRARGGAIKAVGSPGSGRVGGLLLVFNSVDRSPYRDYFPPPPGCDFGPYLKHPMPLLYFHGLKADLDGDLGDVRVTIGAKGLEADGRISLATPQGRDLYERVKAGEVRAWSSGALNYRVRRTREDDPAGGFRSKVTRWHVCEGSLTETPADPSARATVPIDPAEVKAALAECDRLERIIAGLHRAEAERLAAKERRIRDALRLADRLLRRRT